MHAQNNTTLILQFLSRLWFFTRYIKVLTSKHEFKKISLVLCWYDACQTRDKFKQKDNYSERKLHRIFYMFVFCFLGFKSRWELMKNIFKSLTNAAKLSLNTTSLALTGFGIAVPNAPFQSFFFFLFHVWRLFKVAFHKRSHLLIISFYWSPIHLQWFSNWVLCEKNGVHLWSYSILNSRLTNSLVKNTFDLFSSIKWANFDL